ncbi:MAG: hypothetical protein AAGE03_04550 [Pseudomonadota bacterium]
MRKLLTPAVLIASLGGLVLALSGDPALERVGYFKSPEGNRVLAYRASADLSAEEARDILTRQPHTDGRLTRAVIYTAPGRDPGHRLTSAPDYLTAAAMVFDPPHGRWSWAATIDPKGRITFEER